MNQALVDIAIRRGRLIERIANQRAALHRDLQPICGVLHTADQTIARVRSTDEAREGFAAFLAKRPAAWIQP